MAPDDISFGAHGDSVVTITDSLHRLGLLPASQSDFDSPVESAVKAFQQNRGLQVTGIVDPATFARLEEAKWKLGDRVLSCRPTSMMRGDDVVALQSRLTEMGFNCGKVDGIFGQTTENALKEFQISAGVKADGSCGPVTVMAMLRLARSVSGGTASALRENVIRTTRGPALANKVIVVDCENSEIAFDVAQRLEGRLLALGVTVYLTRSAKSDPAESERIALANSVGTDLLISLHTDYYKNEKAHGFATYYYGSDSHGAHSVMGERFATLVQREITARTDLLDCHSHAKTWDLLRLTKSPAVRIDLGYLSNPGDLARLEDPDFRESIVESILIAIQRLYLSSENDAKTGTLRISDLRRAGLRKD